MWLLGFLIDKFGHYKTVVIFSLMLNGLFHYALVLIPQMEIPGKMPVAYVLRHPQTGKVEVINICYYIFLIMVQVYDHLLGGKIF